MPFLLRHIAAFCIAGCLTASTALADDPASQQLRDRQQTLRHLAPRWHLDSPVDNLDRELTGRHRMSLGLGAVTLARERPIHIFVKKSSYLRSKVAVSSNSANIRTP